MITCFCNIITEDDIERTVIELLEEDCWQLIVPAKVYHAMEKRGKCCRCFPDVIDIIIRTSDAFHAGLADDAGDLHVYRDRLQRMRDHYRRQFKTGPRAA